MNRSSRTMPDRYLIQAALAAAVILIALLIVAIIWLGMVGAITIIALAFLVAMPIFKAWEAGKFPSASKSSPVHRDIPYYQPSEQLYTQGYQAETSSRPTHRTPTNSQPKDESPGTYEQPQAQYPEQMPPMT